MAKRSKPGPPDIEGCTAYNAMKPKRRAFVLRYLRYFNASRAARESGYSKKYDGAMGSRLLNLPDVQAAVGEVLRVHGITPERVIAALSEIAFGSDIADFTGILSGQKPNDARNEGANTTLINKLSVSRRVIGRGDDAYDVEDVRLELYPRTMALAQLAKILGMVTEKREISGNLAADVSLLEMTSDELQRLAVAVDGPVAPCGVAVDDTPAVEGVE